MSTELAAAEPAKPPRERALAAVPIVLTVMATILAGLSSSEMTQSMYFRSLAAQNQSKAGSQWAFFQAKRIRGTIMENNGDLLRDLADPPPFDSNQLQSTVDRVESALRRAGNSAKAAADRVGAAGQKLKDLLSQESAKQSMRYLVGPDLPAITERRNEDDQVQALVKAIRARQTEAQTAVLVVRVPAGRIEAALELAEANASAFDDACNPVTNDLRQIERALKEIAAAVRKVRGGTGKGADDTAAVNEVATVVKETLIGLGATKQDFTARRYAKEAGYNQESAELFEVLVRRNGAESDRHRQRSRNFFYAMLCAQAGVTVASFALARSRQSLFWGVAGTAGVIALAFGAYVYLAL